MRQIVEEYNQWLAQSASLAGILAGGVRFPDRACYCQSSSPELHNTGLEAAWQTLSETLQRLKAHRLAPLRMRWSYEQAHIHFICRPDGICLGLIAMTGLGAPEPGLVDDLAQQFLSL